MCGIAGLINLNGDPVSPVLLQRMTDAIAHRGPDGEGEWIERNVGLGHRRLAIIDLSPSGHQPMQSPDGRWVLTYNGEIYNFRELRLELESKGHQFRSNTDSEVVLHSLMEWGPEAIPRFNGMFAFALWDRREHMLLLARDRYGIKPLYYSFQGNRLAFASENKAIITHPQFHRILNKAALYEYFTFQNIFTDQTLLSDIHMLPAGHWMLLEPSDPSRQKLRQYWDFDFREPDSRSSHAEYVEELHRLFVQAVQRQLVSDVEIGAYLSGGIDSGSITAVASASLPNMKSFTCGFDLSSATGLELGFDEREQAEKMSALFKTELYEMVLKSGDMERSMPELAWHLEEPRVGQSYPNFYAAKLASKFVKVVLAGTGGDELFGGYPWRYFRAVGPQSFDSFIDDYYVYWQRLVSNTELRAIFSPVISEVEEVWTRDIFDRVFPDALQKEVASESECINHSLYLESKTFLHGLLTVEDKLSMAHGLEARVPMLDNDLVDFSMELPVSLKLRIEDGSFRVDENAPGSKPAQYFLQTRNGKMLFRDVAARFVPLDVSQGQKRGFSAPDESWFRGESIDFLTDTILNPKSRVYEVLDIKSVSSLIKQHTSGERNRRLLAWSLVSFHEFLSAFDVGA